MKRAIVIVVSGEGVEDPSFQDLVELAKSAPEGVKAYVLEDCSAGEVERLAEDLVIR